MLCGLDIGTTNIKLVVIDTEGKILFSGSRTHTPTQVRAGYVEEDPRLWWNLAKDLLLEANTSGAYDPSRIKGIGVSGMGVNLVVLDESGEPVRDAIFYGIDARATEEVVELDTMFGPGNVLRECGQSLSSQSVGPKLLWLKKHEPTRFSIIDHLTTTHGYVVKQLTGTLSIDRISACFHTPFYSIEKHDWHGKNCQAAGIPLDLFPQISEPSDIVGTIHTTAADETLLPEGIPVIAGTLDTYADLIGAGAFAKENTFLIYASSMSFVATTDSLVPDDTFWPNYHYLQGVHSLVGGMGTSGSLITWLHDLLDGEVDFSSSIVDYNRRAERLGPGSDGLVALPYFNGCRTPFKNGKARGVLFGLSMHHTKYHIYRAILESIGYGLRRNFDAMETKGVRVKRIISSGGGIANALWVQLMSDITGVDQICIDLQGYGAPLGNAYMAGMATDQFTMNECLDFIGRFPTRNIKANPKATAVYGRYYSVFLGLYRDLEQSFDRLADVVGGV